MKGGIIKLAEVAFQLFLLFLKLMDASNDLSLHIKMS